MSKIVNQWVSTEDGTVKLEKRETLQFGPVSKGDRKIYIDADIQYQEMTGFGSSMEESTVYNISQLSKEKQDEILNKLYDPEKGIGWNLVRVCFGSSDFTGKPYYSYDDVPEGETDIELKHFSIQKDIDYGIIDYVKRVMAINPDILVFASPWSPPAWMKESKTMNGGELLPEYYKVAARYYRMAIQAYAEQGIPIYAFTVQNEPLMDNNTYPCCRFSWQQLCEFVKVVKKEFSAHGITTKIWPVDHNFNMAMSYAARMLEDPEFYNAVDGISFHDYLDEPTEMTTLHHRYPEKPLFLTERSVWGTKGIDRILQYFRNWAKCYVSWVTCLDDKRQPNSGCHPADATFVVRESEKEDSFFYIPEVNLCGNISRFIQRGAVRIESNYGYKDYVTNAAFKNPDGTVVLIVVNQNCDEQYLEVQYDDQQFNAVVPSKSVVTYCWQ